MDLEFFLWVAYVALPIGVGAVLWFVLRIVSGKRKMAAVILVGHSFVLVGLMRLLYLDTLD